MHAELLIRLLFVLKYYSYTTLFVQAKAYCSLNIDTQGRIHKLMEQLSAELVDAY